uniref:Uncharacterized protein n=1 Tax=Anguilla anguilla TaxID=7936 RepID=A0A0E9SEG8_ANGAN
MNIDHHEESALTHTLQRTDSAGKRAQQLQPWHGSACVRSQQRTTKGLHFL